MKKIKFGEVKQIIDDLDDDRKFKENKKNIEDNSSNESDSYAIFNPFDVLVNFEATNEIKLNESQEEKNEIKEKLSKERKSSSGKKDNSRKIKKIERNNM